MNDLQEVVSELEELGKVSKPAAASFSESFNRIVPVVEESLSIYSAGGGSSRPLNQLQVESRSGDDPYIRSSTIHFGRSLEAVYRYSLWRALAEETVVLAQGLRARGLSGRLSGLLRGWIMAVISAVGSPEVYELTRPLEILRDYSDQFKSAADSSEEMPAPEHDRDFTADVLAGRSREAGDVAAEVYRRKGSVDEVLTEVFYPALVEIGRRWRENIIGVAEEHAATAALRGAARRFFGSISAGERYGTPVAVTCVPGDEHELGAEIISLYLQSRGWRVFFMGHSLPDSEIMREIDRGGYRAVLLSVSMVRHLPAFEGTVGMIRDLKKEILIIAGGRALTRAGRVMEGIADAVAETPEGAHRILLKLEKTDA